MDPLVSVIIPVYNVAPYLREALDSVVTQSYKALQIIIIDDGSTDGSGSICDEYTRDSRVTVIHRKNRGLSSARNAGLELMTGEYVCFLDPDDAFHSEFIKVLLNTVIAGNRDIAVCRYRIVYSTGPLTGRKAKTAAPMMKPDDYGRVEALQALVDGKINTSVWNKIYQKKLWDGIRFPEGHNYEDVDTMFRVFDRCSSVRVLDEVLYLHRKRPGSITQSLTEENVSDHMLAFSHLEAFVREHIPEVFCEEQLKKIRQHRLDRMIVYFAKSTGDDRLRRKLKSRIVSAAEEWGIEDFGIRTKAAYRMVCRCPRLLEMLYPIYHHVRVFIWNTTGK